jgi:hypothetical protein
MKMGQELERQQAMQSFCLQWDEKGKAAKG